MLEYSEPCRYSDPPDRVEGQLAGIVSARSLLRCFAFG
jgi:hypothetical protein